MTLNRHVARVLAATLLVALTLGTASAQQGSVGQNWSVPSESDSYHSYGRGN